MWRTSTKLRCLCRLQAGPASRCGLCTPASTTKPAATAAAAAKGSQPPLTEPPPPQGSEQSPEPPSGGSRGGGGGTFFKIFGLALAGAGGAVGYAWYDPKFRKQLEDNVPVARTALDAAFAYLPPTSEKDVPKSSALKTTQGALPPGQFVSDPTAAKKEGLARPITVPEPVKERLTAHSGVLQQQDAKKTKKQEEQEEKKAIALKKEAEEKKRLEAEKNEQLKKEQEKRKAQEAVQEKQDMVQRVIQEKEAEEAAENAALEAILSDVLGEAVEVSKRAMDALREAADAVTDHIHCLKMAMDSDTDGKKKDDQWSELSRAHEEKLQKEHKAESALADAKEVLEKLHVAFKDGRSNKVTRKNKALLGAEDSYSQISYDLKNSEAILERARVEGRVMDSYRDLIKKGREQFRKELESVRPDVRIGRRVGGRMTEEELNWLIAHAHRRIEQLQRQLAEQEAMEGLRLDAAARRQQQEDLQMAEARVNREVEHLKEQFELEKKRMDQEAAASCERDIRQQLTRQAAAHSDHLAQVLAAQKDALHRRYEQLLHDEVLAERDHIREEVAGWVSRLKGIEAAIEGRAEMEQISRKAQELWLACQSLATLIETGRPDARTEEEALAPLAAEVQAIRAAGNDHPFVNAVVASLSEEALQRGVWTKEALIERFNKVQRVCRRVAMVDEAGATLFRYFLSYVQSLLVLSHPPVAEGQEVDPAKLDAFMLVNNARHCLERGDLEQAVRYVNQLRGEPRRVASDWLKEARLLLETKQAAEALVAHSASAGLGSLF